MHELSATASLGVRFLEIGDDDAGQRLDNFLLRYLKGVPKSRIYRLLRKGEVRINRGRAQPAYRLRVGDRVRIPPVRLAEAATPMPTGSALHRLADAVLHEDDHVLVVNKPSGMAVHGGSGLAYGLIEAMRELRGDLPFLELAHRLDRETSGCLVLAKRRSALRRLHALMREGGIDKRYLALVCGEWRGGRRKADLPLRKNVLRSGERHVRVDTDGKPSATWFEPLERFAGASLLDVRLITGRTHQIRVHAAHLGHPLAGDRRYGDEGCNARFRELGLRRLFLHAHSISFRLPEIDHEVCVSAPLDQDLRELLDKLPGHR